MEQNLYRYTPEWWKAHYESLSSSFLAQFLGFPYPGSKKVQRLQWVLRSNAASQHNVTAAFPFPGTDDENSRPALEHGVKFQSEAIANFLRLSRRVGTVIPALNAEEVLRSSGPDGWSGMLSGGRVKEISAIIIDEARSNPPRWTTYERFLRFRPLQRRWLTRMLSYDSLVGEVRQPFAQVVLASGRVLTPAQPTREQMRALIAAYNASPYLSASPAGMVLDAGANRDESLLAIHCRYKPQKMDENTARDELVSPGLTEVFPNKPQLIQAIIQLIIYNDEDPKSVDIVLWGHHWIHAWRLVRDGQVDKLLAEFLEILAEPILQWGAAKAVPDGPSLNNLRGDLRVDIKQAIEDKLEAILRAGLKARTWDPVTQTFGWKTLDKYASATVPAGTPQLQATMFRNIYSHRLTDGGATWAPLYEGENRPAVYGFRVHTLPTGVLQPRYRAVLPHEAALAHPHVAFGPEFS
jgi:hypothetical protein